jgi:hypothetical protein
MMETEKSHFLFSARKLRERAEEALAMAEAFRDPEARRMMFEVAERYENWRYGSKRSRRGFRPWSMGRR